MKGSLGLDDHSPCRPIRPNTVSKRSAGILVYKWADAGLCVLLVHPGGPFWAKKDLGAWSIPKGEIDEGEDHLTAAVREFAEETGVRLAGDFMPLGEIRQKGGKRVTAFAHYGHFDHAAVASNLCEVEWPPKSGRKQLVPEIDRAQWFALDEARRRILPSQLPLLDRLAAGNPAPTAQREIPSY
jgi:predicted NUDIX family NTP pyrophosphohydrolase